MEFETELQDRTTREGTFVNLMLTVIFYETLLKSKKYNALKIIPEVVFRSDNKISISDFYVTLCFSDLQKHEVILDTVHFDVVTLWSLFPT